MSIPILGAGIHVLHPVIVSIGFISSILHNTAFAPQVFKVIQTKTHKRFVLRNVAFTVHRYNFMDNLRLLHSLCFHNCSKHFNDLLVAILLALKWYYERNNPSHN